jgi:hypothetical protein
MTPSSNKDNELSSKQLDEKPNNYYGQSITFKLVYKYKRFEDHLDVEASNSSKMWILIYQLT